MDVDSNIDGLKMDTNLEFVENTDFLHGTLTEKALISAVTIASLLDLRLKCHFSEEHSYTLLRLLPTGMRKLDLPLFQWPAD